MEPSHLPALPPGHGRAGGRGRRVPAGARDHAPHASGDEAPAARPADRGGRARAGSGRAHAAASHPRNEPARGGAFRHCGGRRRGQSPGRHRRPGPGGPAPPVADPAGVPVQRGAAHAAAAPQGGASGQPKPEAPPPWGRPGQPPPRHRVPDRGPTRRVPLRPLRQVRVRAPRAPGPRDQAHRRAVLRGARLRGARRVPARVIRQLHQQHRGQLDLRLARLLRARGWWWASPQAHVYVLGTKGRRHSSGSARSRASRCTQVVTVSDEFAE
mmetsp:Transcript_19183/g.64272  ORF Transcript_19183/g.64272 Transcript_19183/m.64272 type:complete len:270 (-) Transcript_19183:104-913(-)